MSNWERSEELADPNVMQCPYDHYEASQEEAPVYYSQSLNAYVITRHDTSAKVLIDTESYSSDPTILSEYFIPYSKKYEYLYEEMGSTLPTTTLVNTDPPRHRNYRTLADAALSAAPVRRMEGAVDKVTAELIDGFVAKGGGDIYREVCMKLPLHVIVDMYGLPRDASDMMESAADAMVRLAASQVETEESKVELHKAQAEYVKFVTEYAEKYRESPEENLLSDLVHAEDDEGNRLNNAEIGSISLLLNVGGNETTTNGFGNCLYTMLMNPEIQERLRAHPEEIPRFIEEGLRMETPVNRITRFSMKDTVIDGVEVPAGSTLIVCLGAANRDKRLFEDASTADIDRANVRKHMAFGFGVHFCVGAKLARLELKIAFEQLLSKTRNIQFDESADAPKFEPKFIVRGVDHIHVKVEPA